MRQQTNTAVVQAMNASDVNLVNGFMKVLAQDENFIIGHYKTSIPVNGITKEVYIFRKVMGDYIVQSRWGGIGYHSLEDIKTLIPKIEKELADNARRLEASPSWLLEDYRDNERPLTVQLLNFLKSL